MTVEQRLEAINDAISAVLECNMRQKWEDECTCKDAVIREMADYIYDNGKDEDVTQWIHECRGENTHEVIIAHFTNKVAEQEQKQGQVKEKK